MDQMSTMKEQSAKIMITGLPHTGKSVLIKLLDGHPDLAVIHTQDTPLTIFYSRSRSVLQKICEKTTSHFRFQNVSDSSSDFPELRYSDGQFSLKLSLYFLRSLLGYNTSYYLTEHAAEIQALPDLSDNTNLNFHPFDFNFTHYESAWINYLKSVRSQISPEGVVDIFLRAYFDAWAEYPINRGYDTKYVFLSPGNPLHSCRFVLQENFNTKIIYVHRSLQGQIFSRAKYGLTNLPSNQFEINSEQFKEAVRAVCSRELIAKHQQTVKEILQLKNKYADKIYMLDIDDFLKDYKLGLEGLVSFLGIDSEDQLFRPSIAGRPVSWNYCKKMNEDPQILDKTTRQFIDLRFHGFKGIQQIGSEINIRAVTMWIGECIKDTVQRLLIELSKLGQSFR
jgi:hypothetical protein